MNTKFRLEEKIEGHFVTLEVTSDGYVIVFINDWILEVEDTNRVTKVKLALAARRLWKRALQVLPAGIYHCWPTSQSRRKLYLGAGWRPTPLPLKSGELIYYHKIPPLPEGWMNWMP